MISEETRKKLRLARAGKKPRLGMVNSLESNLKRSLAMKGRKVSCGMLGKKHSDETKQKIRKATLIQMSDIKNRKKLSDARKRKKGSNWRGGTSTKNQLIRSGLDYRIWREKVFKRDSFICQNCGLKGGWNIELKKKIVLNADHIKPFAYFPELRFEVSNGKTLCEDCHFKTDTYGSKALNFQVLTGQQRRY